MLRCDYLAERCEPLRGRMLGGRMELPVGRRRRRRRRRHGQRVHRRVREGMRGGGVCSPGRCEIGL